MQSKLHQEALRAEPPGGLVGEKCRFIVPNLVLEQFRRNKKTTAGASFHSLQTVDQSARQIADLARRIPKADKTSDDGSSGNLKRLLIAAYADRLCRRRGKSDRALMVGGRGVKLQPESLVKNSEFFVALNGVEGTTDAETVISLACGFDKEFVLQSFKEQIEKIKDVTFMEDKGQFFAREYRSLFGLPLEEPSLLPASPAEIAAKLPQILTEKFELVLKNNDKLAHWWRRLQFLEQQEPQNLDLPGLQLEAFSQACLGESKMQTVMEKDLVFFFENVFPSSTVQTLRKEIPASIEVPSGSRIPVIYSLDKSPHLEVRIQEVFGLMETPKVYQGKIPVTLHLLGPNFRPVQVTSNLESFWKNGYPEVRKELRIKYPKHQWPEDPADGTPEAKGRRRPG